MTLKELLVPYGLDREGRLVHATQADRLDEYFCIGCGVQLVLRAGTVRKWHFGHASHSGCTPESVLHKTAKILLSHVIEANATGMKSPKIWIAQSCVRCGNGRTVNLPAKTFSAAKQELRVGEFICDVVAYRGKEIALAIEVLKTSAVSERKAKSLKPYWIELRAEDVVENPYAWRPVRAKLKRFDCGKCNEDFEMPLVKMTYKQPMKKFYDVIRRISG